MLIEASQISDEFRSLIESFPNIRLASAADGAALADFVNSTAMSAGVLHVTLTRGADYFALMRLQGETFAALVCEDEGRIVAVGALTIRQTLVRGTRHTVGYLQDLRVAGSARSRVRMQFYQFFADFIRLCPSLPEFNNCFLFLTAILDDNTAAKAALSRSSFPLEYTRLARYTAHMWPKVPLTHDGFGPCSSGVAADVRSFYESHLDCLSYDLTLADVERLMSRAHPVVIRSAGQIQAACLLVNTDDERRLRVGVAGIQRNVDFSGVYITALRTNKQLTRRESCKARNHVIRKALLKANVMSGVFTGFVNVNDGDCSLAPDLILSSVRMRGSLYRVFHPDNTRLKEFSRGFLRPQHQISLEWVLM